MSRAPAPPRGRSRRQRRRRAPTGSSSPSQRPAPYRTEETPHDERPCSPVDSLADPSFEPLPFYCPIEPRIHPEVGAIERGALDWLERVRIWESEAERDWVVGTNSAELVGRLAPDGIAHNLQIAARWVYWGSAFDDARCDTGPVGARPAAFPLAAGPIQRVLEAPDGARVVDDALTHALQDIGQRLRECATPVQMRRFVEAHRCWLFNAGWQVASRAAGGMPGLDDYVAMRLGSRGGPPTLALLEIANGAEVPADEMDSPAVRALTEMACLVAGWDNDLHSYRREIRRDRRELNVVTVLAHHRGCTAGAAVVQAVGMRDRVMHRFLRLRERVQRWASLELRSYLQSLGDAIRGNIDWALRVPRSTSLGDPSRPPAAPAVWSPGWTDRPSDPDPDPLPIPAIRWWWDQ